jgi:hypothetical protein
MNNISIASYIITGFVMMGGSFAIVLTVDPTNDLMTGLGISLLITGVFSVFAGMAGAVCR